VHVAHEIPHLRQGGITGPDDDVDPVAELVQVEVGDQGSHLDEGVGGEGESGHLAVDPDDAVGLGAIGRRRGHAATLGVSSR